MPILPKDVASSAVDQGRRAQSLPPPPRQIRRRRRGVRQQGQEGRRRSEASKVSLQGPAEEPEGGYPSLSAGLATAVRSDIGKSLLQSSMKKSSIDGNRYLDYLWELGELLLYIYWWCWRFASPDSLRSVHSGNQGNFTALRQHPRCGKIR
jgi:hypothetical protein